MILLLGCWIAAFLLPHGHSTPYDLDGPCQEHIHKLARVQAAMTQCATNFSSPPKVCTNCIDYYIDFKQTEYATHHLTNVTSLDNRTCSSIFYDSYALSYGAEISNSLTEKIWDSSRCASCLIINWQLETQNSTIEYDQKTIQFEKALLTWRSCVSNFTDAEGEARERDHLHGLWEGIRFPIYKEPGIDFCLDVETTMNDTMNIWHSVWKCPDDDKPDRKQVDLTIVCFSASFLAIVICLFYSGSYIQVENAQRNLVRYSRIQPPRGPRSRLLSSSTVDESVFTPTSSQHG
ncbi:hypothetical protein M3Y99_00209300 [Aphelenchoides fujianensis]|nr:hypothetical protein M3Y99_00209300 [Aphelenchoides fujianensis]